MQPEPRTLIGFPRVLFSSGAGSSGTGAMREQLQEARQAAIDVMRAARRVVETYGGHSWACWNPDWPVPGKGDEYRGKDFGDFIRLIESASAAVSAVDAILPRSTQPVRYGPIVAGTAHHVAVKFARQICASFFPVLGVAIGDDFEAYQRLESGGINPALLRQCANEIKEALSKED